MAVNWFYEHDGTPHGPFLSGQLKELAAAGRIQLGDTVWQEGMARHVPAGKVRYLFGAAHRDDVAAVVDQVLLAPDLPQPAAERHAPVAERIADATVDPMERPGGVEGELLGDMPENPTLVPLDDEPAAASAADPTPPPAAQTQAKATAEPDHRRKPEKHTRRVVSVKGGTLMGQDGQKMKVRKKCTRCSKDDTSVVTMPIPNGTMRMSFYCPKCRKNSSVEIQGGG